MIPVAAEDLLKESLAAFNAKNFLAAKSLAERVFQCEGVSPDMQGRATFHLAQTARELGDSSLAVREFERFISEANHFYPGLKPYVPMAYFYIALAHRQAGNYPAATTAYLTSITGFLDRNEPNLAMIAQENLVWLYCLMGQPEAARRYYADNATFDSKLNQAFILLTEGNPASALETVRPLLSGDLDPEQTALANWLEAKAYIATGDYFAALDASTAATQAAIASGDNRLMRDAATLRVLVSQLKRGA